MKCDFAMRPARGIVAAPVSGFDARWTVKDRHTRLPTEQEVAEINAKHLISTPIKPADLLFVFGTREDGARHSAGMHPGGTSRDQHRRKRHLLAAHPRSRPRACEYPQRNLPRQHLDGSPLPDDAAPALAGRGEDADISRQLRNAVGALAHRSGIPGP